jgi:hypothetical protein
LSVLLKKLTMLTIPAKTQYVKLTKVMPGVNMELKYC